MAEERTESRHDHGSAGALDAAGVRKLARLARLAVTDADIEPEAVRLSAVLGAMDVLREAVAREDEPEHVTPMAHAGDETNRMRADAPGEALSNETLMAMAPETLAPFVRVPKVIGEGGGA
ncbi:MAG: Asp-tRNA(Asn)/Glu-tRNA(Gln) amidotransferase subunit GatC [Planctomycetota bacterium]